MAKVSMADKFCIHTLHEHGPEVKATITHSDSEWKLSRLPLRLYGKEVICVCLSMFKLYAFDERGFYECRLSRVFLIANNQWHQNFRVWAQWIITWESYAGEWRSATICINGDKRIKRFYKDTQNIYTYIGAGWCNIEHT